MTNRSAQRWNGSDSRQIIKRVVIEGTLTLQTPAHFGSGDEAGSLVPLSIDERAGKPLLTGASIGGALRAYLVSIGHGVTGLFGQDRASEDGNQSALIISDAYGQPSNNPLDLRDGVKINPKTRTAADRALYTFATWSAGTTFTLRFELLISKTGDETSNEKSLLNSLASALYGFIDPVMPITLGARKNRGYGRVSNSGWRVREFDLTKSNELMNWIYEGAKSLNGELHTDVFQALGTQETVGKDRGLFSIQAQMDIDGSLLIRSASTVADTRHLRSGDIPVLSGTSLGGAIRARALKILSTLFNGRDEDIQNVINAMFGTHGNTGSSGTRPEPVASRIRVEEHPIINDTNQDDVQTRVSIDRFTGGALDTALFSAQPQFGGRVQINLTLRNPEDHEIGLLLLVLKDLWTGDLPLGGESSIGRGRLKGKSAAIQHDQHKWTIQQTENGLCFDLDLTSPDKLQCYVDALFCTEAEKEVAS